MVCLLSLCYQLWVIALQHYGDGMNMHSRKQASKTSFHCTPFLKARQYPCYNLVFSVQT